MNLKEKLQELAIERQNLTVALYEVSGAMKILEHEILEAEPVSTPPPDTKASTQEPKIESSKSKA